MAAQKPPFIANDIQSLYRKICIGSFPRIPTCYSNELSDIISAMLRQNTSIRPSTEELLEHPLVIKNCPEESISKPSKNSQLLNTIKLDSKNWKSIVLPKPKYADSLADQEEIIPFEKIRPQSVNKSHSISRRSL